MAKSNKRDAINSIFKELYDNNTNSERSLQEQYRNVATALAKTPRSQNRRVKQLRAQLDNLSYRMGN